MCGLGLPCKSLDISKCINLALPFWFTPIPVNPKSLAFDIISNACFPLTPMSAAKPSACVPGLDFFASTGWSALL